MTDFPEAALVRALPFAAALLDALGVVLAVNTHAESALGPGLVGSILFRAAALGPAAGAAEADYRRGIAAGEYEAAFESTGRRVLIRSLSLSEPRALAMIFDGSNAEAGPMLAQIREIASKVKHDANNILMVLLGQASLLMTRPELSESSREKAGLIEEQGRKLRDTVARLDAIRLFTQR